MSFQREGSQPGRGTFCRQQLKLALVHTRSLLQLFQLVECHDHVHVAIDGPRHGRHFVLTSLCYPYREPRIVADDQKPTKTLERFSKPNFGSIRRFRTMTGLEIENWIEKRDRTVRKFRSTRPRTESNFRFGLTSCRSQNLPSVQFWSPVAPLSGIRQFFSCNLVKFTPCLTPPRIYTKSDKAKLKLPFN